MRKKFTKLITVVVLTLSMGISMVYAEETTVQQTERTVGQEVQMECEKSTEQEEIVGEEPTEQEEIKGEEPTKQEEIAGEESTKQEEIKGEEPTKRKEIVGEESTKQEEITGEEPTEQEGITGEESAKQEGITGEELTKQEEIKEEESAKQEEKTGENQEKLDVQENDANVVTETQLDKIVQEEPVLIEELTAQDYEETFLPFNQTIKTQVTEAVRRRSYEIVLTQPGKVQISAMAYMAYGRVGFYTEDNTQIVQFDLKDGSINKPASKELSYNLDPGRYYINLERSGVDGIYQLRVDYTPVSTNEIEPNNGIAAAQDISINGSMTRGFISETDDLDIYRVVIPSAGRLTMDVTYDLYGATFKLIDVNNKNIYNHTLYKGSGSYAFDLEAGVYYIYIAKYYDHTGLYYFSCKFDPVNSNDIEPNNGFDTAQELKLTGRAVKGFISKQDEKDYYKINVTQNDQISINITSSIKYVYFYVYNSSKERVVGKGVGQGSVEEPAYYGTTLNLTEGVYYILVDNSTGTGTYMLEAYSPLTGESIRKQQLTSFATRMYEQALERKPDSEGLNYWVSMLESGKLSGYAMANYFVNSREFVNKGLSDSQYLNVMYKAFFGRQPDSDGKAFWMQCLANNAGKQNIFEGFVNSPEYKNICDTYDIPFK